MSLCYVESLSRFRLKFFKLWPFKKIGQFLKNSLYMVCTGNNGTTMYHVQGSLYMVFPVHGKISLPMVFFQKMAQKSQKNFITFSDTH